MSSQNCNDGDPDYPSVDDVVGALKEAQIADQEGDLEKADAHLVKGSAGVVDARIGDEVGGWAQLDGESEAIFRL